METKCSDKLLYDFFKYCLNKRRLPLRTQETYATTYKHVDQCPRCGERLATLLETYDLYELVIELKHLPIDFTIGKPLKREAVFKETTSM